jgi:hypothetical protein
MTMIKECDGVGGGASDNIMIENTHPQVNPERLDQAISVTVMHAAENNWKRL